MSTSTTNLGLIKPARGEKINIDDINGNSDTLDARIGAVPSNTSLQAQITALGGDTSARARTIYLSSSDNTWAKVWAKIDVLSNGETATIYFNNAAITAFSNNARTTGAPCGTISRLAAGKFCCNLVTSDKDTLVVMVEGATSSSTGTYSERSFSGYKSIGSFATVTALNTALDSEFSGMSDHTCLDFYFTYTGGRDYCFAGSTTYQATLIRSGSGQTARVIISAAGGRDTVIGYRVASGWHYTLMGSAIKLTADDSTWAQIWERLDNLYNGDTSTIYLSGNAMSALTNGQRSGVIFEGTVTRINTNRFSFLLGAYSGGALITVEINNATEEGYSASTPMTYTEFPKASCMTYTLVADTAKAFTVANNSKIMFSVIGASIKAEYLLNASSSTVTATLTGGSASGLTVTTAANKVTITATSAAVVCAILFSGNMTA